MIIIVIEDVVSIFLIYVKLHGYYISNHQGASDLGDTMVGVSVVFVKKLIMRKFLCFVNIRARYFFPKLKLLLKVRSRDWPTP